METLLQFAQGPLFRFALVLMVLGLTRHLALSVYGYVRASLKAGGQRVQILPAVVRTLAHINPLRYVFRTRGVYSVLTLSLHVGLLTVPLMLAGHITLWREATGFGWAHLPSGLADALTLLTIGAAAAVLAARAINSGSRRISRPQDWLLPPLILVLFGSGYLAAHPSVDVLPYPGSRLVHVLTGDLLLILVPLTKLSHMILLPFSQIVAELGWKLVPGAGDRVRRTLAREGQSS